MPGAAFSLTWPPCPAVSPSSPGIPAVLGRPEGWVPLSYPRSFVFRDTERRALPVLAPCPRDGNSLPSPSHCHSDVGPYCREWGEAHLPHRNHLLLSFSRSARRGTPGFRPVGEWGNPSGPRLGEGQGYPPVQAWQGQRRPLWFRPGGAWETLGAQGRGRVEVGSGPPCPG